MKNIVILLFGCLLIGLLAIFCINTHREPIETDLTTRTLEGLKQIGLTDVTVAIEGRDLSLRGNVPDADLKDRAVDIAEATRGVRIVHDNLTIQPVAKPPPPKPKGLIALSELKANLGISINESTGKDSALLSGWVPDSATKTRWVKAVVALFGSDNVRDELKIAQFSPSASMEAGFNASLPHLQQLTNGNLSFSPTTTHMTGLSESLSTDVVEKTIQAGTPTGHKVVIKIKTPLKTSDCQSSVEKALKGKTIEFGNNSAVLSEDSDPLLRSIKDVLARCPNAHFRVEGHTDSVGKSGYNTTLSQERAASVLSWLKEKGIANSRGTALGFGESKPIASNNNASGRARNRRIEFRLEEEASR